MRSDIRPKGFRGLSLGGGEDCGRERSTVWRAGLGEQEEPKVGIRLRRSSASNRTGDMSCQSTGISLSRKSWVLIGGGI